MAKTVEDVLHELSSRFLLNVSDEEFRDTIRIGFQMEQAHWWYIDYYSSHDKAFPELSFGEFAEKNILADSVCLCCVSS
eukprot:m.111295 g.111295  ORF g.111295 m.111295 type:complete len:79 (-) comp9085_c0_seq5:32-268(-)